MASGLLLGIRLGFHNHAPEQLAIRLAFHQQAADEVGGNQLGRAGEEGVRERLGKGGGYGSGLMQIRLRREIKIVYTKAFEAAIQDCPPGRPSAPLTTCSKNESSEQEPTNLLTGFCFKMESTLQPAEERKSTISEMF